MAVANPHEFNLTLPVPGLDPTVTVRKVPYHKVDLETVSWLTSSIDSTATGGFQHLGLDTEFDGPKLGLLQLATSTRVLLVIFPRNALKQNEILEEHIIANGHIRKTGAELWKDALLLYMNGGHRLRAGYDLTRVYNNFDLDIPSKKVKGLFAIFNELYFDGRLVLKKDRETTLSKWVGVAFTERQIQYAALDGWVSLKSGTKDAAKLKTKHVLDLHAIDLTTLDLWSSHYTVHLEREGIQARSYISHFSKFTLRNDGVVVVVNSEFRNKLEHKDEVRLLLRNDPQRVVYGRVQPSQPGKTKMIKPKPPLRRGDIVDRITVIEPAPTRADDDFRRELHASGVLHGLHIPNNCPFFSALFARKSTKHTVNKRISGELRAQYRLNPSQSRALETILYAHEPISLIHGPPGTGKSTTISAAVHLDLMERSSSDKGIFVVTAQTNAATKNLADALFKRGVKDFRILVADNYYVEWHEERYTHLHAHVVQTSEVITEKAQLFGPRTVVLCSLAQLSNANMIPIFQLRRIRHIIMDEASQVFVGDLPHVFQLYSTTLRRVTFVGDPHQLAPYGSDTIQEVQSVFDLRTDAVLLNVQYRMPPDIANFLSEAVYKGRLSSGTTPTKHPSVSFVNVPGKEDVYIGGIKNEKEADIVVKLLTSQLLAQSSDLLVITPYNRQRELIVHKLKACRPQLKDSLVAALCEKVRTIDTVQGQEAKIIVLSLVRTHGQGFLNNYRRVNVALSRVKTKLVIVGKLEFFQSGKGSATLAGKFVDKFSSSGRWDVMQVTDVRNGKRIPV